MGPHGPFGSKPSSINTAAVEWSAEAKRRADDEREYEQARQLAEKERRLAQEVRQTLEERKRLEATPHEAHETRFKITLSYRRDDSGLVIGRVFDRLVAQYGRDSVFRDIDNIPPGVDFRKHIAETIEQSDVVIAVIGPDWVGPRGGVSRLKNRADPVRTEIEMALQKNKPLVPVLVLGATMPDPEGLPEELRDFAYRHAVSIDAGLDFDVHFARLVKALDWHSARKPSP